MYRTCLRDRLDQGTPIRVAAGSWVSGLVGLWWVMAAAHPAAGLGPEVLNTYQTKHYTIHTNLARRDAQVYGRHMDRMFVEYSKRFKSFRKRDRQPMSLYLVRTRDDYIGLLDSFGINGSYSGGMFFYAQRGYGLATWVEGQNPASVYDTLQHEGFHQFAHVYIGRELPIWVNEGLAEYFGDGLLVGRKMKLGLATERRVRIVQKAIRENVTLGFDYLLGISAKQWHHNMRSGSPKGSLQYHQSWSVVYFLIHGDRGRYRGAFEKYLQLVGSGRQSEKAFRQAFGTEDTEAFRKRWESFAASLKPDPFSAAVSRIRFLGRGLKYLLKNDRPMPATLDQLRDALQQIQYRLVSKTHGVEHETSAMDESQYRFSRKNGAEDRFKLLEPEALGLPPRIVAPGLRPEPTLVWSKGPTGELAWRIQYK